MVTKVSENHRTNTSRISVKNVESINAKAILSSRFLDNLDVRNKSPANVSNLTSCHRNYQLPFSSNIASGSIEELSTSSFAVANHSSVDFFKLNDRKRQNSNTSGEFFFKKG